MRLILTLFLWLAALTGHNYLFAQQIAVSSLPEKRINEDIFVYQLFSDTLFDSQQQIHILRLPKNHLDQYSIKIGYTDSLKWTSAIAKENNAIAAVNGSFFNMDKGGAVTYHENKGKVVYPTREEGQKWAFKKSLLTGAIIINKSHGLQISQAESDEFYKNSDDELAVLVSGPLLLLDNQKSTLPDLPFVKDRHPRTCLCETENSILLIAIDGRSVQAVGMSLLEAQSLMYALGCGDAINLDGGGSVTMWGDNQIINAPSDKAGERAVANAILIVEE